MEKCQVWKNTKDEKIGKGLKNNSLLALNMFYVDEKEVNKSGEVIELGEIKHAYIPKLENQAISLMISNDEKFYLTGAGLSALLKWITSKYKENIYCFNCFNLFRINSKLGSTKKGCNNCNYCEIVMPDETKIVKYHHGQNSFF